MTHADFLVFGHWAMVADIIMGTAVLAVLYVQFWQNRPSQWDEVTTINEITYFQHKKYNRRSWTHKTKSLSERGIRWDWLRNKVENLD